MVEASEIDRAFAAAVAAARADRKLSRAHVAAEMAARGLEMHETAIGKIERGDRRVTVGEASALSEILGLRPDTYLAAGKTWQLSVDVDRAASNYLSSLTIASNTVAGLRRARAELAAAIERFDREGEPYANGISASDSYETLLALDADDTLGAPWEHVEEVTKDYYPDVTFSED